MSNAPKGKCCQFQEVGSKMSWWDVAMEEKRKKEVAVDRWAYPAEELRSCEEKHDLKAFFPPPTVKHCGKWDKGEVLTVLGIRWLTRFWLWLYHQMTQAVEMLTRSQMCQVQHLSHSLSRLQVKAFSHNTVALSIHCTPTGDHCTPLKETFFHTVPGGPHLSSSLTVYSFSKSRTLLLPVSDEAVLARHSDFLQLLFYFIFDGINR